MRRDLRNKNIGEESLKNKILVSAISVVLLIVAIVVSIVVYQNKINGNASTGKLTEEQLSKLNVNSVNSTNFNTSTESASSSIGKTVEDGENEIAKNSITTNSTNTVETNAKNNTKPTNKTKSNTIENTTVANTITGQTTETKEVVFTMPVEGEIIREFAKENLVYSDTLKEWVTHNGIDIKADKTSVVKAASAGTIKSIKNDPRYGLTIVITHDSEFETVYSNLLTAEFVVEGEKVDAGQTIGTVGNTASFEIVDEPHLHFEIWKNSEAVNPTLYFK